MRNRVDRDEWCKRVARWQRSGLTAREFAEQAGLNAHTLTFWKWRLGRERREAGAVPDAIKARVLQPAAFVEVVAGPAEGSAAQRGPAAECVEVILVDGVRIRVPGGAAKSAVAVVASLVAALEAR